MAHYSNNQYQVERKKLGRRNNKFKRQITRKTRGHCAYCGTTMKKSKYTIDHIIPVAKGGRTVIKNLVLACEPCNQKKDNLELEEFREIFAHYNKNRWGDKFWFEYKEIEIQ